MQVTVNLYANNSSNATVSKVLTAGPTYTCQIKRECSIERPYFLVTNTDDISDYNYLYCTEFKRYYYILKRNISLGGMVEIEAVVDPLVSFAAGIRNLSAVVDRQEFKYNPYIEDPLVTVVQGTVIKAIKGSKVGDDSYTIYLTALGAHDATPDSEEGV